MSRNEKALYEFKFIFGYITLKEQYEFLKFIIMKIMIILFYQKLLVPF